MNRLFGSGICRMHFQKISPVRQRSKRADCHGSVNAAGSYMSVLGACRLADVDSANPMKRNGLAWHWRYVVFWMKTTGFVRQEVAELAHSMPRQSRFCVNC